MSEATHSTKSISEIVDGERKPTLRRKLLNWLGYLAVFAAILFFFAPESWWQFGVAPVEQRKTASGGFTLPKLEGGNWNFADQRGKVVVVNYWATWCPPCRIETPGLVNVANEYKSRGVEMVGVSMDEDRDLIAPFVEKYQMPYQILLPGDDPNVGAGGMGLPTTFLYDKNGKLAKKYTGMILESTLKSDIELLLGEN
ncbi:MAG TPA: TlpA disulfide reductase family protein [Pyrinomonadaceae bacterium]|nr:TlpA disulfide reductase family protein [Pyrinomonadaceae bacterium]